MAEVTGFNHAVAARTTRFNSLRAAAISWYTMTAIGQWLFVLYIFGYFGLRFLNAGTQGFDDTHLPNGFIADDTIGNAALAFHILVAGAIIAAGQIQLIPQIRQKAPLLHRISGRFYMLASVIVSIAGVFLIWTRERQIGSLLQDIGTTGSGVLVLLFVPLALYYAIKRNIAAHRRWALRLFMAVSAVWFLRLMIYGWFMLTGGIGIDAATFSGPFMDIVFFAQYLLPLAILELYFKAQQSDNPWFTHTVALIVLSCTMLMAIGIFAVSVSSWLPRIG